MYIRRDCFLALASVETARRNDNHEYLMTWNFSSKRGLSSVESSVWREFMRSFSFSTSAIWVLCFRIASIFMGQVSVTSIATLGVLDEEHQTSCGICG